MNREVCEHFNPVDLPCAKCAEKRKSEAMFLADELEAPLGTIIGAELHRRAAAELRRLHAERAAADGVINDLVAKVRELQKENTSLSAALASSCDEQRHELWESGGIAGCERARVAERQRDALLEALKTIKDTKRLAREMQQEWCPAAQGMVRIASAAIKAVEGEKK